MNRLVMNMSAGEYHGTDAVSVSGLKEVLRSPRHYKHRYIDGNRGETKSLSFGHAFHALVLEPDTFNDVVAIAPDVNKRTNAGKEEYAAFVAGNAGKTIITADEYDIALAMSAEIAAHPMARTVLTGKGNAEASAFWVEEVDGVEIPCRARFDWLRSDGLIVDLKTTSDASVDGFVRLAYKYGYHMQAWWYMRAYEQVTLNQPEGFAFICAEKDAPYCANVFLAAKHVTDDLLELGRIDCERALKLYAECKQSGKWHGYSDSPADFIPLDAPAWAKKQLNNNGVY